jgi:hypothetical protein
MRLSVGLINSEVSRNQLGEMTEQVSSKMDLHQQMQLIEVKDQDDILMIGGIGVFLPCAQEEAKIGVVDGAAAEQSQRMMIVKEELEKTLEAAQAEEENEHSEECLNIFSQEAERAIALELAAKEAKEQAGKVITPWEMELAMLEDWLNNPGLAKELTEVELSGKVTKQQVSQRETAELKSAAEWQLEATDEDEERSMGDHGDLPDCRKFLQLRRLQQQDQPLEQLDQVIEDIRRLMVESTETTSEERLSRKEVAAVKKQQQQQDGVDEQLQRMIWDPGGFPTA